MTKTVMVTGHRGYIGSVQTRVLLERGYRVIGVDTGFFDGCDFGTPPPEVISIHKDIRDLNRRDFDGIDAIMHLAALCNDPLGDLNRNWTMDINYHGSVRLAKLAREAGVGRFIYASSCSMYGAAGDCLMTEAAPLAPLTPYAESKVRTEEKVSEMADNHFSPVFMRNATVYGVSPRLRSDIVLNNLVCWAHTTGKIRIVSDGTPWRPIIHVEDVAHAFMAALEAPRAAVHNQAFNIGANTENYQVRDIANIVRETVPDCTVEFAGKGGPDPRNYRVDFSKASNNLPGFQTRWTARMGSQELYAACQNSEMTLAMFQSRKYTRLAQFKHLLDEDMLDDSLRWKDIAHREAAK